MNSQFIVRLNQKYIVPLISPLYKGANNWGKFSNMVSLSFLTYKKGFEYVAIVLW